METLYVIVKALALGALGRQWAATHDSVLQLYSQMQARLQDEYPGVNLARLEESPQSAGVQFLLKEDLSNVVAAEDELLVATAQRLIDAVADKNPELLDKLAFTH
ncbi:MAG: hypothetical protein LJE85_01170 [Gammaproteobacteria bacterium]|nr:hypothetical protein [Gammaproteobacteria bacterium]